MKAKKILLKKDKISASRKDQKKLRLNISKRSWKKFRSQIERGQIEKRT